MPGKRSVLRKALRSGNQIFLAAADLRHYFSAGIRLEFRQDLVHLIVFIGCDHTVHRALLPQEFGQRAGINSFNPGHVVFFKERMQRHVRTEIAGNRAGFPDNERVRPGALRFHVFRTYAVIADERIRHADSLPRVAGIRQNFRIAGHRGIENNLAHDFFL